jgi:hypothetical protein
MRIGFVSRFCITFAIWGEFLTDNVRFIIGDNFNFFDSICGRSLKKGVYELNIPNFYLRDPKVMNFGVPNLFKWSKKNGSLEIRLSLN